VRDGGGCRSRVHDGMVIGPTVIDHHRTWGSENIIKFNLGRVRRSQHGEVAGVTTVV
jgi:hypothetical protein